MARSWRPRSALALVFGVASAAKHFEYTEDRIGPFPADIFDTSYHNYVFRDGCFPTVRAGEFCAPDAWVAMSLRGRVCARHPAPA